MPEVKSKNVELLSLYGVLVNPKVGTRNDRDGTVTIQAFASLLQCFQLKREQGDFVDDLHEAVLSLCVPPLAQTPSYTLDILHLMHLKFAPHATRRVVGSTASCSLARRSAY